MDNREKNRGRNVINIGEIKEILIEYSQNKQLSFAVSSWVEKTFLRWIINSFPYVQLVQSSAHYLSLVKGTIPAWFQPNNPIVVFVYIEVKHREITILLDKCTEFLESREVRVVHKFPRMTVAQVLQKWEEEHLLMISKSRRYIETTADGLKRVFEFNDLYLVYFKPDHQDLSLEMARESALMQHCLGEFDDDRLGEGGYGAYYIQKIRDKEIKLFSLRDKKNMPHATIALYQKSGIYWLEQIKGKQNRSPVERYIPASVAFLNSLDVHYNHHSDTLGMGIVYIRGKSRTIEDIEEESIQELLVAYDTTMIHKIKNPSKSTLWLATLRTPSQIENLEDVTDTMKLTALLQQSQLMLKVKFSWATTAKNILKNIEKYSISGRFFKFIKLQVGRIE